MTGRPPSCGEFDRERHKNAPIGGHRVDTNCASGEAACVTSPSAEWGGPDVYERATPPVPIVDEALPAWRGARTHRSPRGVPGGWRDAWELDEIGLLRDQAEAKSRRLLRRVRRALREEQENEGTE